MGAVPAFALNIAALPTNLPSEIIVEIIRGGAETVRDAGAVIIGGHSIQDKEPKYGLVAVGFVDPNQMMTKDQAKKGDIIVLTKPLGTGVTTTALRAGKAAEEDVEEAVYWMTKLNRQASQLAKRWGVRAGTDVTGFSLLGHGLEIAEASEVNLQIHLPCVPFFQNARKYAHAGFFPGGSADNRMFYGPRVEFAPTIDEYAQMLLFDAQTSGGLLLMVPREKWEDFVVDAGESGVDIWPIGMVMSGAGISVLDTTFDLCETSEAGDRKVAFISP